jgi:hypothetical protein
VHRALTPVTLGATPEDTTANKTVPAPQSVSIGGASAAFNATFAGRIDGNFTGTTDEIIQRASCKWAFDEPNACARDRRELLIQSSAGDNTSSPATCAAIGSRDPAPRAMVCFTPSSRRTSARTHATADSTVFPLYPGNYARACHEGELTWLNNVEHNGAYAAADLWGCVGTWFSGRWYVNSLPYIALCKVISQQSRG